MPSLFPDQNPLGLSPLTQATVSLANSELAAGQPQELRYLRQAVSLLIEHLTDAQARAELR